MLGQLRDVAERPARVIRSGLADNVIRQDEALRALIRDFLGATGAQAHHQAHPEAKPAPARP
jgi:hypothetical protein